MAHDLDKCQECLSSFKKRKKGYERTSLRTLKRDGKGFICWDCIDPRKRKVSKCNGPASKPLLERAEICLKRYQYSRLFRTLVQCPAARKSFIKVFGQLLREEVCYNSFVFLQLRLVAVQKSVDTFETLKPNG